MRNREKTVLLTLAALTTLLGGCSRRAEKQVPLTAEAVRGQRLFQSTCAVCHRADSTEPLNGPGLKGIMRKPHFPSGAPANQERLLELLKTGRRSMPPYEGVLDERQMNDIIAYLHTL